MAESTFCKLNKSIGLRFHCWDHTPMRKAKVRAMN